MQHHHEGDESCKDHENAHVSTIQLAVKPWHSVMEHCNQNGMAWRMLLLVNLDEAPALKHMSLLFCISPVHMHWKVMARVEVKKHASQCHNAQRNQHGQSEVIARSPLRFQA